MRLEDRFAGNLVFHRKAAGLSQEELGFLADLHRTEVGMLERGTRLARMDTLLKLCGALEITPNELLVGIEWKPSRPVYGSFSVEADGEDEV